MMRTMDEVLTADFRTAPTPQEVGKWKVECDQLRAKNARFVAELKQIANDYYPVHDSQTALALQEMRDALLELIAKND